MTSESGAPLLGELLEPQATGEIAVAVIDDEVLPFPGYQAQRINGLGKSPWHLAGDRVGTVTCIAGFAAGCLSHFR